MYIYICMYIHSVLDSFSSPSFEPTPSLSSSNAPVPDINTSFGMFPTVVHEYTHTPFHHPSHNRRLSPSPTQTRPSLT